MKKAILFCLLVFCGLHFTYSQITLIPDANFEQALINLNIDSDNTINGQVFTADISGVTNLNVSNSNISDFTGLEDFSALSVLNITNNSPSSLDLSPFSGTLTDVNAGFSPSLTTINIGSNTNLINANFGGTSISSIDLSSVPNLESLNVFGTQLTNIDLSNVNKMKTLGVGSTPILSLDLSGLSDLLGLDAGNMTALNGVLDLSNSPFFQVLAVTNSQITALNLKNGNNSGITTMIATGNPNLTCIAVDSPTNVPNNWQKDAIATYTSSCNPTTSILSTPTTTSSVFNVTIQFSSTVNNFDINDIVLTNATVSNFVVQNGSTYTVDITPTSQCVSPITIDVPASVATDNNGTPNDASIQVSVAVLDNTLPTVITQDVTIQLDANGQAAITVNDIDNGSSDNCNIATRTLNDTTYDCSNIGANNVTLTVIDSNGNSATGTAILTVEDNISPNVIAQDITVQLDVNGQVTIQPSDLNGGTTDNCAISLASLTASQTTFTCANLGTNTVTLTASDVNGNSASDTATVTVQQNPNQQLTAIAKDITVILDANGQATITPQDVDDGSGSGCNTNPTLSLDITAFDCTDVGTVTVTLTATEGGSTDTDTAIVTVLDNVLPTVFTQDVTVQLDANGQASITADDIDNGSTDNCGIASRTLSKTNFDCSNVGQSEVVLTVEDTSGNTTNLSAVVTVEDNIAPNVITQNATIQLDVNGQVTITSNTVDGGSSDNCAIASRVIDQSTFTCSNLGANIVTLTVTDVNGNVASDTALITVEEEPNQQLTAITQDITVQLDANGQATITPQDIDNGSGSGCSSNPTLSLDRTTFECNDKGTNTVTLTATQGGTSDTATAVVTVEDNLAPIVITQNITVILDVNGDASITTSDIDKGSTDNCAIDGLSLDKTTFTCSDLGDNTVTLRADDVNGNNATGTATVTVVEDVAPTVVTQDITVSLDTNGEVSITAQDIDNGSSDACSGIANFSLDTTSFSCPELGDKMVTLTVVDNSGNTASATAIVTVTSDDNDNDFIADVCDTKEIIVSKGFSPNGDNIRDTWTIENIMDFPRNMIQVFNRWGEKVYVAENYQNDWDGISNQGGGSKRLPVGPYLYIIRLNEDGFMPVQGWVYLNY